MSAQAGSSAATTSDVTTSTTTSGTTTTTAGSGGSGYKPGMLSEGQTICLPAGVTIHVSVE